MDIFFIYNVDQRCFVRKNIEQTTIMSITESTDETDKVSGYRHCIFYRRLIHSLVFQCLEKYI